MPLGPFWASIPPPPEALLLLFLPLLLLSPLGWTAEWAQVVTHMRQILYGCDIYSMYHASAIDAAKFNERSSRARKAHELSTMVSAGALAAKDQEVTLDGVVASAFLEHFRAVVAENGAGVFCTGPLPLDSRRLSVAEAMGPEARKGEGAGGELALHCLPWFRRRVSFQRFTKFEAGRVGASSG
eukprot:5158822-Pyramimonas_sp.AAC.1